MKGSQKARFYIAPSPRGYAMDHATKTVELAAAIDFELDEWQAAVIRAWMRTKPDGSWCVPTWGLSVPRQNGKNGLLMPVMIYMAAVLGLKILYTSHHMQTSRKQFTQLLRHFGRKVDDPHAKFPELNRIAVEIRKTNGQECITLSNGGCIELSARTGGAGRGSTFDVLVVDEAQEYEPDEQEALEPTTSAAPSGDPLTIYMGTPPRVIGLRGEPFVNTRTSALKGAKTVAWVEHSADGEVDKMTETQVQEFVRNRRNWAKANPALGIRIVEKTIEGELARFSPRSFARERLNMWPSPVDSKNLAIDLKKWKQGRVKNPSDDWPLAAIGLDMNPARTKLTITMALYAADAIYIEIAAQAGFNEAGTKLAVDWLWKRAKRRIPVVMDAYSPARSLEPHLKQKKMKVRVLDGPEYGQACMGMSDAIREGKFLHFDQTQLNLSVQGTVKENMGRAGAWKFARTSDEVELMPSISAACAWFGAIKFNSPPKPGGTKPRPNHAFV